jgi:hypothetical protein
MQVREPLTPDVLHFVTCVVEEEAHFIWIMMFWLTYKCSLTLEDHNKLLTEGRLVEERLKVVVRGLIEMIVALVITKQDMYAWVYCTSLYVLAAIRSIYLEKFDLFASIFLCSYMIQNLIVNLIDWVAFKGSLGFYQDNAFV